MNIIDKFGNMVSSATLKDSEKARRLLLAGYRLQEKRLCLFPDRALPSSGSLCGENSYEKYYSGTVQTGKFRDGQYFCAGRTADGSRINTVFG